MNPRHTFCFLCSLLLSASLGAADKLESKTTYAKAYGETKGNPTVDPAKDLPRYPAVEPKDAIATWQVKKGFKLELAAQEPQVRSPIAVSFDERGRMFVCEMIDYSEMRDVTPHLGRISMLEDKDGDGHYETSTVFADNLAWPTGIICANGGIYVVATPDVIFFKDTKDAGKADVREVVFTGLGTGLKLLNVQGLANCPQWGQDNRIHIQCGGGNRGKVKCLKRPDLQEIEIGGRDLWFDPRTYDFGLEAGGGQFGMSFDNYGRKFACSNSDHLQFFVYDDRYAARNPYFDMPPSRQSIAADGGAAEVFRLSPDEPWRIVRTRWRIAGVVKGGVEGGGRVSGYFTGATGTTVYRGDAYGDDFVNNTFSGDAGGQLVHRKKIYPDGVSLIGKRPDDEQNFEFAASKDTWVRVVNFSNAPDGCLYVMDMYREVIEHPWSIPDEIKKHVDLNNGNDRGRIYRIAPDKSEWKRRANANLSKASTEELVKTLEHPNGWHRDTAHRLLYERNDKAAVPMLEKMVIESSNPLAKLHALGVLSGLGELSETTLKQAFGDTSPMVRQRAVKLAERFGSNSLPNTPMWQAVKRMAADPDPLVRFQVALTAGEFMDGDKTIPLLQIIRRDVGDPWISNAVLNAPPHVTGELLTELSGDNKFSNSPVGKDFLRKLIHVIGAKNEPKEIASTLGFLTQANGSASMIRAFAEGLKRAGTTIAKVDTEKKLAAVFAKAGDTARDGKATEAARLEAINLVSLDTRKLAVPVLLACLEKSQPESVQSAAVTTLGPFSNNEVMDSLIAQWPGLQKKARSATLSVMMSRPENATTLLHAIEAKKIATGELTASDVQALFKHKDQAVATLANKVLAELKPPSRASVIAKFQPAMTTKGDFTRGQIVFTQRCMACHKANNLGVQVGPDLITVKTKGRDGIFTAILDPNKEIAPQFIAYTVNTKDGQTLAGIITNDTANSMTLKIMGGVEMNIPRANIKGSSAAGISLMPEGIEADMSVQDMADLLDFIEKAN